MKYLVLIPDGMADEPIEALGGVTPMEKANKPCMDSLAKVSLVGTVSNVPADMVPESDTANLAILSYDPKIYSKGRSPLEAVSMGIDHPTVATNFKDAAPSPFCYVIPVGRGLAPAVVTVTKMY